MRHLLHVNYSNRAARAGLAVFACIRDPAYDEHATAAAAHDPLSRR